MNSIETLRNKGNVRNFDSQNLVAKRNTLYATILTFVTMIAEIIGGYYYNSMALLADGWHMSSHVLALGLAYITYVVASKYANDFMFSFGTYKIEVLGGFTSAIFLIIIAVLMAYHSIERLINPIEIAYKEAMIIAVIGLIVNLICAWLLKGESHDHHDHNHDHHHHGEDINLKAAYIHVLTDALTSLLAIFALAGGMLWGANWLDAFMGIVGSVIVFIWAWGILKQSSKILVDAQMDMPITEEIIEVINSLNQDIIIEDLHISRVGKGKFSSILVVSSNQPVCIQSIKKELSIHEELVHIIIEVK